MLVYVTSLVAYTGLSDNDLKPVSVPASAVQEQPVDIDAVLRSLL